jgi:hypothetical protein
MHTHYYGWQDHDNKAMVFKKRNKSKRTPMIDDLNIINGWRKKVVFATQSISLH